MPLLPMRSENNVSGTAANTSLVAYITLSFSSLFSPFLRIKHSQVLPCEALTASPLRSMPRLFLAKCSRTPPSEALTAPPLRSTHGLPCFEHRLEHPAFTSCKIKSSRSRRVPLGTGPGLSGTIASCDSSSPPSPRLDSPPSSLQESLPSSGSLRSMKMPCSNP